ncbi:histidine phosphatase family protein [Candidatus Chloroploca sp. M-50]|uniref:Histidine phosphatase family protein n=1 Tax=Candidatus Chloroploca mongolica TaxID=2528176 RepID=A0ABS4DB34_9CHLR|nr:histidine phosphatase family protein [Candidatus Chloroploca mongolica]MBP1466658.1 histidine phosphatase family protein [Candidatus Chloroploca mongolica]
MSTTILLIRHGETDWNMTGRWQGHTDVPLNAIGLQQAELVASRLAQEGRRFDAIYSSDLARAYETARAIGAAVKVAVQLLPSLREIDLGTWSGLTYEEIKTKFPDEIALLDQNIDIPRGGGESLGALRTRVVETVTALGHHHQGQTLALVTHGGCIRMLLAHADNYAGDGFKRFPHIGNTSISVIEVNGNHWTLSLVNDMSHLTATNEAELISAPPDDAEQPAL